MDLQQRFLRRKWLLDSVPLLLRESIYHRTWDAEEELPSIQLWKLDEEEGQVHVATS